MTSSGRTLPATDMHPGTVAMIAAPELDGSLIRSLTAELSRRGTVHGVQASQFPLTDGEVRAVRWSVTLDDSDDSFGSQLLVSLLEDAAAQSIEDNDAVTTTVLPAQHRPIGNLMLTMDVDSTLIDQEVIDLLAAHAGREREVAQVTERAMRGELDFTESLHARVAALQDLPDTVLGQTLTTVTPTQGAHELIDTFRRRSWPVYAVSGGFLQILSPLAEQLGLTGFDANDLQLAKGRLTGRVTGQVVDRRVKRERLLGWAQENTIEAKNVVAVGDGANDLDMINAAGVGVAFCAKPALSEQADLVIAHRNMELIAYALGLEA